MFRRTIFWLLPVVIVPLCVLVVMQYRFLRSLETNQASAHRNWMRTAVEDISRDIESYYRGAATRALAVPPDALADASRLSAHFTANPVLGAKSYFTVRYFEGSAMYQMFDRWGVETLTNEDELQAVKLATVSWHVVHKHGTAVQSPALGVDERDSANRVILRPVTGPKGKVIAVAGVVLDPKLTLAAMTNIAKQRLGKPRDVVLLISDRFPPMPHGRDFVTHSLAFVFADWRAGIRGVCLSPEEIAAAQFKMNSLYTGGVSTILFGAVFLALQATSRHMRLSQMKSDFVSNVSHELRTPLASIRVFGEYMRLGRVEKPEKVREYGEYIENESRRLTQLINNILDFSKIESAEKKYKFCETDVAALVSETVSAFAMPLREHGVAVSFHPAVAPLPLLPLDRDAMAQVLMNLLDNAVKYSGDVKEIDVALSVAEGFVRIAIRDRGIGIPAAEQKKIFEKFYRVGSGLVHDVKGSGLGLAIVTHVVRAHGGRVEVASMPGSGSTFTIVLPQPPEAKVAPAAHPTSEKTEFA
ncbi:MAG: HAMP domain-containing histidine kinase [Thermoanaerobaculia bacterium]|nr:HAMP domain-containing histidine kinase [Thermoanaerobaculia bacterium]